jgi:hypothetical protein
MSEMEETGRENIKRRKHPLKMAAKVASNNNV